MRNFKVKKIFKTISLVLLGLGTIGGIVALTTHLIKKDSVSIHPTYDVGGLNAQGRYEEDKTTLYTKERFACEGLQATLDFDAQITYQIFYYDIVDNFISSTEVLTEGCIAKVPLNGAYARIEITPTNDDDDDKISFSEKLKYSKQLNLKVAKNASSNVSKKFLMVNGHCYRVVKNIQDSVFEHGVSITSELEFDYDSTSWSSTTKTICEISDKKQLNVDLSHMVAENETVFVQMHLFQFNDLNDLSKYEYSNNEFRGTTSITLNKDTKLILISLRSDTDVFVNVTDKLPLGFTLTKASN